jgi:hypothetical protein
MPNERSDEKRLEQSKDAINEKIDRAIAQLNRGEGISVDELRARLEKRKAAWLADQPSKSPGTPQQ